MTAAVAVSQLPATAIAAGICFAKTATVIFDNK